ncbi:MULTISPECIES: hypothetical protein [Microcystis]|uniref:hypothetical protein n=1 Tax=Microcystis TaxID=1125 RepID=UPI0016816280|nr:hypothetical protein [Microcystis wesenbergii]MBD2115790.1 hypothetical protein [Microcystis wesenbergii FACHB-1339]
MSSYIIENGQVVIQAKTSVFVQRDPTIFIKGDPGASAYELALQNGFVGTEKDWLDSLENTQWNSTNW